MPLVGLPGRLTSCLKIRDILSESDMAGFMAIEGTFAEGILSRDVPS
jgi:hypothetical protein